MSEVDDYVLERIITLNKLLTQKQIDECKRIQEQSGGVKSLADIILEKKLLTKKTVEKIMSLATEEVSSTPVPQESPKETEDKLDSAQTAKPSQEKKQKEIDPDETFLKIAIHNKLINEDQVKLIKEELTVQKDSRAWNIVVGKNILSPKMTNAILEKLQQKFGDIFKDRVSVPTPPKEHISKPEKPVVPPKKEEEKITEEIKKEVIQPKVSPERPLPPKPSIKQPEPVKKEPESREDKIKKTPVPASSSTLTSLSEEHKTLMRRVMCSRLHFQLIKYFVEQRLSLITPKDVAKNFGEKEKKVSKILKEMAKYVILKEMGKDVYTFAPGEKEKRLILEILRIYDTPSEHSKVMSYLLSLEK